MNWIWIGWAICATTMIALSIVMEVSAIRGSIDGANGLAWFVAMVLSGVGSAVVALISWIFAGPLAALAVVGCAAAALTATWFACGMYFNAEVRRALSRKQRSMG